MRTDGDKPVRSKVQFLLACKHVMIYNGVNAFKVSAGLLLSLWIAGELILWSVSERCFLPSVRYN